MIERDVRPRHEGGLPFTQLYRRFEMISNLSVGGSGNAYVLVWDSESSSYIRSQETFTVYDVDGFFGASGEKGRVFFAYDAQRWEVDVLVAKCPRITFTLSDLLLATDATIDGCTITATRGGVLSGAAVGATVTLHNELGFVGEEGSHGYAEWDDEYLDGTGRWIIYQMECAPEEATS